MNVITLTILLSCIVIAVLALLIRDRAVKWLDVIDSKSPAEQPKFWRLMTKIFFVKDPDLTVRVVWFGISAGIVSQILFLRGRDWTVFLVPSASLGFFVIIIVTLLGWALVNFYLWFKERRTKKS